MENGRKQVQAVITDGDANVTPAVRKAGLTHLYCFAHTLNLVVQNGVRLIKPLQDKVKAIVEYFHRSTVAADKLRSLQQQLRPGARFTDNVLRYYRMIYPMTKVMMC